MGSLYRINFKEIMAGRKDPLRDEVGKYYDKLADLLDDVVKPEDIPILFQQHTGLEMYPEIRKKATYLASCSLNNYIKFRTDGLLLWLYDLDKQEALVDKTPVDLALLESLRQQLDLNVTKHPYPWSKDVELPFNDYNLLVLQEIEGTHTNAPSNTMTGRELLLKKINEARTNKHPLIIRPHPYISENRYMNWSAINSDYIYVAEQEHHPLDLIRGAKSVSGITSSLLIDSMIYQKPTFTYGYGEFHAGATGDIKQQNKWLSWYFNDVCINIESDNCKSEIRKRLDLELQ